MKLHLERTVFEELIKLTANELNVNPLFIEKDYWITVVLSRLAKSKYVDVSVFKGGTSLSKGYNLNPS
jgi:predicted nucleotidyltransferase component of viral defense system